MREGKHTQTSDGENGTNPPPLSKHSSSWCATSCFRNFVGRLLVLKNCYSRQTSGYSASLSRLQSKCIPHPLPLRTLMDHYRWHLFAAVASLADQSCSTDHPLLLVIPAYAHDHTLFPFMAVGTAIWNAAFDLAVLCQT